MGEEKKPEQTPERPQTLRDLLLERKARGEQLFFAWGDYDEKEQRPQLQTGHC